MTKVQYIKENDVTDLGLVFAEEEFGPDGGNPKVCVCGGGGGGGGGGMSMLYQL